MRLRCFLRFCSYGAWRTLEASSIESDGEWVRQRAFERRECVFCGRRQERSTSDEWQGYHISAAQESEQPGDAPKSVKPAESELRKAASRHQGS